MSSYIKGYKVEEQNRTTNLTWKKKKFQKVASPETVRCSSPTQKAFQLQTHLLESLEQFQPVIDK